MANGRLGGEGEKGQIGKGQQDEDHSGRKKCGVRKG